MKSIEKFLCVLLLLLSLGCGAKYEREFVAAQLTGENDALRLSVRKVLYKKDVIRVWATLENKTDQNLTVNYGAFKILVDGQSYPGALRVPFARVTKDFPMTPKMIKELPGPIEVVQVLKEGNEGVLTLENVTPAGQADVKFSVSVTFPLK